MKKAIHTTLDIETYNYLKNIQKNEDIQLNEVIKQLVDKSKDEEMKMKKMLLSEVIKEIDEIIRMVLMRYKKLK